MRIYIDLSIEEEANIHGMIHESIVKGMMTGPVVLTNKSLERLAQLKEQFISCPVCNLKTILPTKPELVETKLSALQSPVLKKVVELGVLSFTTPTFSRSFGGEAIAIAELHPPTGYSTNINTISVYEQYQTSSVWRQVWLSKVRGDMSANNGPAFGQGSGGVTLNYSIGGNDPNVVNMQPGEIWWLMVANRYPNGILTCPNEICEIGVKWYPPTRNV